MEQFWTLWWIDISVWYLSFVNTRSFGFPLQPEWKVQNCTNKQHHRKELLRSFQFRISSTESKVKTAWCIENKQYQKEVLNISFHSKVWISSTEWKDNTTSNVKRRHVTGKNYLTISFPKLQGKIMMMMMLKILIILIYNWIHREYRNSLYSREITFYN